MTTSSRSATTPRSVLRLSPLLSIGEAGCVPTQIFVGRELSGPEAALEPRGVNIHIVRSEPAFAEVLLDLLDMLKEGPKVARELVPATYLSERGVVAFRNDSNVDDRHRRIVPRSSHLGRSGSLRDCTGCPVVGMGSSRVGRCDTC